MPHFNVVENKKLVCKPVDLLSFCVSLHDTMI
jgi:hypothetical protein